MALKKCEAQRYVVGFYITASSSDGKNVICALGNNVKIRHVVTVKNLRGYPGDVQCNGEINGSPRRIKFDSQRSNDQDDSWSATQAQLPDKQVCQFDHVRLLPESTRRIGDELIEANIEIDWAAPALKASVNLGIQVSQ